MENQSNNKITFRWALEQLFGLVRESVLFSGAIALILVITACQLVLNGMPVPKELYLLLGTVIGFFFGGKVGVQRQQEGSKPTAP